MQNNATLEIEQRSREITQIATSISELADLFRDLGNLVVEQGTVLDSVEYNVQMTAKSMEAAVEELTVAKRYQSNTGKRKCILLLILIIVGLIIVLIYKPRRHASPADPTPTTTAHSGMTLSLSGTRAALASRTPSVGHHLPGLRPSLIRH